MSSFLLVALLAFPAGPMVKQDPAAALVLFRAEKWKNAEPLYESLVKNGDEAKRTGFTYRLGVIRYHLKNYTSAVELLEQVRTKQFALNQTLPFLSVSYAKLGQIKPALDRLEEAITAGYGSVKELKSEDFKTLRDEPRYKAVLEHLEFPLKGVEAANAMDFWVGDWEVAVTGTTRYNNKNHIEKLLRGYLISENWTDANGSDGKSFFYFDQVNHIWKQSWIDETGWIVEKTAKVAPNGLVLDGKSYLPSGVSDSHEELIRVNKNQVRQKIYGTTDGGKTWILNTDLTYRRVGTNGE